MLARVKLEDEGISRHGRNTRESDVLVKISDVWCFDPLIWCWNIFLNRLVKNKTFQISYDYFSAFESVYCATDCFSNQNP